MFPPTTLVTVALSVSQTFLAQTGVPSSTTSVSTATILEPETQVTAPINAPPVVSHLTRHSFIAEPSVKPVLFVPESFEPGPILFSNIPTPKDETTTTPDTIGPESSLPSTTPTPNAEANVLPRARPMWHGPRKPAAPFPLFNTSTHPDPPAGLRLRNLASRTSNNIIDTYTIIANFDDLDVTCSRNFSSYDLLNTGDCFPLAKYKHDIMGVRWGTGTRALPCGLRVFKNGNCTGEPALLEDWVPEPGKERECRSMEASGGPWGSMMLAQCCLEVGQWCEGPTEVGPPGEA